MALATSLTKYAANAPVIVSRIGTDIALLIDPMSDERYFYVWMGAVLALGLWITLDAFAG